MARHRGVEQALGDLADDPDNQALREQAARALMAAGRHAECVEVLGALVNLTAHDGPTLPCLCRRCLDPERVEAEAEGLSFLRRFVVAQGRVLYYWAPEGLAEDPGLLRSVRARLDARMKGQGAR